MNEAVWLIVDLLTLLVRYLRIKRVNFDVQYIRLYLTINQYNNVNFIDTLVLY